MDCGCGGLLLTCRLNDLGNLAGRRCSKRDYSWCCGCGSNKLMLKRGTRCWRGIRDGFTQCSGILSLTGGLNHRRHDRGLFGSLHGLLLSRGVGSDTVGRRGGCSCRSIRG